MLFFKLGATNAWRNIARSTLAVLSMALAAAFLTNAISLSRGYPQLFRAAYRAVIGGEIVVYDLPFSGEIPEGESTWSYEKLGGNPFTDLDVFFPELAQRGYLNSAGGIIPFDASLQDSLAAFPGISGIYPRYQMPALTEVFDVVQETPLRGRDPALDAAQQISPEGVLFDGRWLSEEDEGKFVAVVSRYQSKPQGLKECFVGDVLQITVPRLRQTGAGIGIDYQNPVRIELEVVGTMQVTTRTLSVSSQSEGGMSIEMSREMHWQLNELQIPLSTWQAIWEQAADFTYQPRELSLMVDDMSYIEDQVLAMKQSFPGLTFMHVPFLANKAESQLLIEDIDGLPLSALATLRESIDRSEQSAMPIDLRSPLSLLIFLNAALVVASNLLIMINERKTEIGILKAVGAFKRQIMEMALSEAILIASLGAVGGFIFIRFPATLNQLTNRTPLLQLLQSLGFDLLLVMAASFVAALVFGLLPALRMAGLSVSEVMRGE